MYGGHSVTALLGTMQSADDMLPKYERWKNGGVGYIRKGADPKKQIFGKTCVRLSLAWVRIAHLRTLVLIAVEGYRVVDVRIHRKTHWRGRGLGVYCTYDD